MSNNLTIQDLKERNLIVFEAVMGSHAYGTNGPESDVDVRGIYVQPLEDILGMGYVDQVSDDKNDTTYYEIRRFLELVQTNNPNILELLCAPSDCIRVCDDVMDRVFSHTDKLVTKKCKWTFGGYAAEQIKKARGLNKKMNWEEKEMTRKTVLDFCYVLNHDGNGSMPFKNWIDVMNARATERLGNNVAWLYDQKCFGLSKIDHARDCYGIYFIKGEQEYKNNPNYAGIVSDEETANDVHLTSFSKKAPYEGILVFNKDGYSSHCKRYNEYQVWLKERNPHRIKMNKAHGKNYDGKNMNHCIRLLTMGLEIAEGKGIIVRRKKEEIKKLLSIKKGEYEFEQLMEEAENLMGRMEKAYEKSHLPDNIEKNLIEKILIDVRKTFYGMSNTVFFGM